MPQTQSLDQIRAAHAWTAVQNCTSDYTNLAKAAPALIMSNGLMQTLAFLKSKGKNHHSDLLKHITEWMSSPESNLHCAKGTKLDFSRVMTALHGSSSQEYLQATQEVLEYLRWIRHFAAAVSKD